MRNYSASWRLCHVCEKKTRGPSFCTSCGHPLCKTCSCEVPEASIEACELHAAAKAAHRATPRSPSPRPKVEDAGTTEVKKPLSTPEKRAGRGHGKNMLQNNPFLIADQIVKTKIAQPQTSNANVEADARHESRSHNVSEHGETNP